MNVYKEIALKYPQEWADRGSWETPESFLADRRYENLVWAKDVHYRPTRGHISSLTIQMANEISHKYFDEALTKLVMEPSPFFEKLKATQ